MCMHDVYRFGHAHDQHHDFIVVQYLTSDCASMLRHNSQLTATAASASTNVVLANYVYLGPRSDKTIANQVLLRRECMWILCMHTVSASLPSANVQALVM